ncbi:MAG: phage integrase central domain-containing protein [Gammaproteobacteria bacterium]
MPEGAAAHRSRAGPPGSRRPDQEREQDQRVREPALRRLLGPDGVEWQALGQGGGPFLQTDARPYLGSLPAREITPAHIRDVLYRLIRRDAPVQANRLRSHLRTAFQWGVYHDNNPAVSGAEALFQLHRNPVDAVPKDAS